MRWSIFTLFPEYFKSPLSTSLLGKSVNKNNSPLQVEVISLRDFGEGKHRVAEDTPFGGGPGMVLQAPVFEKALSTVLDVNQIENEVYGKKDSLNLDPSKPLVLYVSPQGTKLDNKLAKKLAQFSHISVLCGHFEGVDQRIVDHFVHLEVSVGDYVLMGGEVASLVLLETVSRFVPEVIGDVLSVSGDTFEDSKEVMGGLKAPVYTRPAVWREDAVPEVLLSGNHQKISEWRSQKSLEKTRLLRPDLLAKNSKK